MRQRPKTSHLFLAGALACLPVTIAVAQAPQQFEEIIEVSEVQLDVLVTDRDGNVILGLQPADFVVGDGGEEAEVSSATFYSNRKFLESEALASRLGVAIDSVPVDRYFVLFFHDPRSLLPGVVAAQLDAVRWARRWVHQELVASDYVAVLTYDYKLKVHQDFTADKEATLRALDAAAKGKDSGTDRPQGSDGLPGRSLRESLPRGDALREATKRIYSALETVAEAARPIVGRKNLMMFSVGFGEPAGFSGAGVSGSAYLPDERYYEPMIEALNDGNVAVYPISLLKSSRYENLALDRLGSSLSLLAEDTGGQSYFSFLNFRDPLRDIVKDNSGYYLLSFPARHPRGESGYRRVSVSTRNEDFVIRAREGYRYGG